MQRQSWAPDAAKVLTDDMDWTVTVIEALPNCPNIKTGWERFMMGTIFALIYAFFWSPGIGSATW